MPQSALGDSSPTEPSQPTHPPPGAWPPALAWITPTPPHNQESSTSADWASSRPFLARVCKQTESQQPVLIESQRKLVVVTRFLNPLRNIKRLAPRIQHLLAPALRAPHTTRSPDPVIGLKLDPAAQALLAHVDGVLAGIGGVEVVELAADAVGVAGLAVVAG